MVSLTCPRCTASVPASPSVQGTPVQCPFCKVMGHVYLLPDGLNEPMTYLGKQPAQPWTRFESFLSRVWQANRRVWLTTETMNALSPQPPDRLKGTFFGPTPLSGPVPLPPLALVLRLDTAPPVPLSSLFGSV